LGHLAYIDEAFK